MATVRLTDEQGRTLVADEGSMEATVLLVGEAAGAREETQGRPFVGPSGRLLSKWLRLAGLEREDVYITNVVPWRPPGNNIATVTKEEMAKCVSVLRDKIAMMPNLMLIVPIGNVALRALMRFDDEKRAGILRYRGSILAYRVGDRTIKVVPTLHPAATFRQPSLTTLCEHDWRRIGDERKVKELWLPKRRFRVAHSLADINDFFADVHPDDCLSIDIETPRSVTKEGRKTIKGKAYVGCIAFAKNPYDALTIPLTKQFWKNEQVRAEVLALVKQWCESPNPKILQSGHFDAYWLKRALEINVTNFMWDTRWMHHALEPRMPHDLATLGSIYTREPYWKDEAKDPDTILRFASNSQALWEYCGKDACVTYEVSQRLEAELRREQKLGFYKQCYQRRFAALLHMMLTGVGFDVEAAADARATLENDLHIIEEQLEQLAGKKLTGAVGLSSKKVQEFLYETLRLPKKYKVKSDGDRTATADEVAIRKLLHYHPEHSDALLLILEHRRKRKLIEALDENLLDDDGKLRCSFGFAPETGRLSCSANPQGTGRSLQTLDRDLRHLIIPSLGGDS